MNSLINAKRMVYQAHPELLLEELFGMMFPIKVREVVDWYLDAIKLQKPVRAIIKSCRGGGKSKLTAAIEFISWWYNNFDCVNLGGSSRQAEAVYSYLFDAFKNDVFRDEITEPTKIKTVKVAPPKAWIKVLAASAKQIRSPHAGSKSRGGLLIVDEACEAEDRIIKSALPIVSTASPSAVIFISTFHKAFGVFQDTWDNAEKRGWKKFEWGCFDVAENCDIECSTCSLLRYCEGRAKTSNGWIKIPEILQAYKDLDDEETFKIEYLGSRPSTGGLVYDPLSIDKSLSTEFFEYDKSTGRVIIGIDWGYSPGQTCAVCIQKQKDILRVLDIQFWHMVSQEEILEWIEERYRHYSDCRIRADSSHTFQNVSLKKKGLLIVPVKFGVEKSEGISNVKWYLEKEALKIPEGYEEAVKQLKNYRRHSKTGKPIKLNDHFPDALMCAVGGFPGHQKPIPIREVVMRRRTDSLDPCAPFLKKEERYDPVTGVPVSLG